MGEKLHKRTMAAWNTPELIFKKISKINQTCFLTNLMCVKKMSRCAAWRFRCLCGSSFKIWKKVFLVSYWHAGKQLPWCSKFSCCCFSCTFSIVRESELVSYISLNTTEIRVLAKINKYVNRCQWREKEWWNMASCSVCMHLTPPGCTARLTWFHRKSRHFLMPAKLLSCSFLLH